MGIQFRRSGYDVRLAIRISSGSGMDPGVNRMNEPGTISIGENSVISIDVEGESYRIGPKKQGLYYPTAGLSLFTGSG